MPSFKVGNILIAKEDFTKPDKGNSLIKINSVNEETHEYDVEFLRIGEKGKLSEKYIDIFYKMAPLQYVLRYEKAGGKSKKKGIKRRNKRKTKTMRRNKFMKLF